MAADSFRSRNASTSRPVRVGAWARLERAAEAVSAGRVSSVDRELVGIKTTSPVDGRVEVGDSVILVVGEHDSMVASDARVLAATGSYVRLSLRESSEELDRRRALRVPIEHTALVTGSVDGGAPRTCAAEVTDLSTARCAIRAAEILTVGGTVGLTMQISGTEVSVTGRVVRAWRSVEDPGEYAGILFDAIPAETTRLISNYLVERLRHATRALNSGEGGPIEDA